MNVSWHEIEKAAARGVQPVSGGYSQARRGVVTLDDGQKVFIKIAVDELTSEWLQLELKSYHWLGDHNYVHAPRLVAEGSQGLALPDFSAWDWTDTWSRTKLDAALRAMDALAEMSNDAKGVFPENKFGDNPAMGMPWTDGPAIPESVEGYKHIASRALLNNAATLVHDKQLHALYAELASSRPWQGDDLVHYDVRADNFAYNPTDGQGLLVDWNWLCFGSKKLDQTALLVNAQWTGYDVLFRYADRLDINSLAWFVGFWLTNATKAPDTENMKRLRPRQLECAVVAHELLRAIK